MSAFVVTGNYVVELANHTDPGSGSFLISLDVVCMVYSRHTCCEIYGICSAKLHFCKVFFTDVVFRKPTF